MIFETFRSAITGDDGEVDAGYLGLYAVMVIVLGAIPTALVLAAIRMVIGADHPLDLTGVAAIIGAAGIAFGTAAGGVGLFRAGDKPRAPADPPAGQMPAVRVDVASSTTPPDGPALEAAARGVEPPATKRKGCRRVR